MFVAMPSPKSSVGSKSSGSRRNYHFQHYQDGEVAGGRALSSSWIHRLHLRPVSSSSSPNDPQIAAGEAPHPPEATPLAVNFPCPIGSGGGATMLSHQNTISTHESRASTSNIRTTRFHSRLPPVRNDNETCFSTGFGPFQVRKRKSLDDAGVFSFSGCHPPSCVGSGLVDTSLEVEVDCDRAEHGALRVFHPTGQDSAAAINKDENYIYNRNPDTRFPSLSRIDQEKGKRMSNWNLQHNWVPFKSRKFFAGENLLANEGNFVKDHSLLPQKRVTDDHYRIPLSPFFRYQPNLTKHDFSEENRPNGSIRSSWEDSLPGPSGEADDKFTDSNLAFSHNLNQSLPVGGKSICSPSLRPAVAANQRLYKQSSFVTPWPTTTAVNGSNWLSRNKSVVYHGSRDESAACRTSLDSHLGHHEIVPCQNKRRASAYPNKPDEPFSFWNMDRLKRNKIVPYIFKGSKSDGRKRNADADKFVSTRLRKLGTED